MPRELSLRRQLEILIMITTIPTPFENHDAQEELLRLLLSSWSPFAGKNVSPPNIGEELPIMHRLKPTFRGFDFTGRDFFQ